MTKLARDMSAQELFDTARKGINAQGRFGKEDEGKDGGGMCRYRTLDGNKCSIGMLLTDDEVANSRDADGSEAPLSELISQGILLPHHWRLLRSMRSIHDAGFRTLDQWNGAMDTLANDAGLTL